MNAIPKCPACRNTLELVLEKGSHARFTCRNEKCLVASVMASSENGEILYWTKAKRIGENGSVYLKVIHASSMDLLSRNGHHVCEACGLSFAEGDIVTLAPDGLKRRGRQWAYYHELCYEKELKVKV